MNEAKSCQVPIRNGDGELLYDEDGNYMYEQPGWRVLRDQNGMVLWDDDGQLCIDEVEEDELALQTRSVHKQAPESLLEQNQRLQVELQQSQFVHQSDVKRAQQMLTQAEAQNQTDFCAMVAELETKRMEFAEERRLELEKYQKALCASRADKEASDTKWAAWVQQLQMDQVQK